MVEGTFLDENLRQSESDLLFEVEWARTGQRVRLYVLLEHQSSPERWMPLRVLKYCCRIWDRSIVERPGREGLPAVLPVVFYQGARGWRHSTELGDLFPAELRAWPWVPRFRHVLLDETGVEPEGVGGSLKGRITRLLLMASASAARRLGALRLAGELAVELDARYGRQALRQFIAYLLATQDEKEVDSFKETAQRDDRTIGDEIMSYAEQLRAEGETKGRAEGEIKGRAEGETKGRAEGEQRGKVEAVEGFLRAGVTWEVIETATGRDESAFRALKQQVSSRPW